MARCPIDLVDAAAEDRLADDQVASLQSHLSRCKKCCARLDSGTASPKWWNDASRLLDDTMLDDPLGDIADSSTADARLFEDDDPVGELKAAGVIDSPSHPEMLGQLGRYAIERELGAGGMGVVLKGFDAELNRTVAIKVLAPHLARSAAARQRFIREGRAAAAVVHENIVAIHEVDTSGRLPTLVMHYVDGVSLQRHVDTIGPLPVCDALRIASQTAAGLAAAHRQGIIHRDVKPANILIGGGGQRVWITDFGLARAVDDASLTRTGFIAGTPHYMSPEQARGGPVGPESDLFSLGSVMYFMLAARPPWRAERSLAVLHRIVGQAHRPLWQVNSDVPREVSDLVDELLAKTTQDRVESAAIAQERLEEMLAQMQNPNGPHSLLSGSSSQSNPAKPWWYSRPMFVAPATVLATLLLVNAIGWTDIGRIIIGQNAAPKLADGEPIRLNEPIRMNEPVRMNEPILSAAFAPRTQQPRRVDSAKEASSDTSPDFLDRTLGRIHDRTSSNDSLLGSAWPSNSQVASDSIREPNSQRPFIGPPSVTTSEDSAFVRTTTQSFGTIPASEPTGQWQRERQPTRVAQPVILSQPNMLSTTPDSIWEQFAVLDAMLHQAESANKPSTNNPGNQQ